MSRISIAAVMFAFCISALAGPLIIPFLRRLKCGQTVRDDGPAAHLKKSGTPTMGGILILFSAVMSAAVFLEEYPKIAPILFLPIGCGFVGGMGVYI